MPIYNITGDDTLTLFGRVITDIADGDASTIEFPNDLVNMKTGKNGNSIFAKNETGNNAEMTLRVMRGSADDAFLQTQFANMKKDFPSTVLATGQFSKRMGDGQGNVRFDIYTLLGGVIYKGIEGKSNVEGDTDQSVAVYNLRFAAAERSSQ